MGKVWPPEIEGCPGWVWQLGPLLFSRYPEVLLNKKESETVRHQSPGRLSTTGICFALTVGRQTSRERASPVDGKVKFHRIDLMTAGLGGASKPSRRHFGCRDWTRWNHSSHLCSECAGTPLHEKAYSRSVAVLSRKLPAGLLRQRLEVSFRGLPSGHPVGCRAARINSLAEKMSRCEDYLEVGVQYGFTLASVDVKNKTGVDPNLMFNPKLAPGVKLHRTTSDGFFSELPQEIQYDLIFGRAPYFEQTARDFLNALKHLRPGASL